MTQDTNNAQHFNADEGNTFVQKGTNMRYGNDIYLSADDSIDNYVEDAMTDDEIKAIEEAKKVQNEVQSQQANTPKKGKNSHFS